MRWLKNYVIAIMAAGSLWMGNHMRQQEQPLRIEAAVRSDAATVTQEDTVAVASFVKEVGAYIYSETISQLKDLYKDYLEEWDFGSLSRYDLAIPPGLETNPDELRDWALNRRENSIKWHACRLKVVLAQHPNDPDYEKLCICNNLLVKETCKEKNSDSDLPELCRNQPRRDLPRTILRREMTLFAGETLHDLTRAAKYFEWDVDSSSYVQSTWQKAFNLLLTREGLRLDRMVNGDYEVKNTKDLEPLYQY
ncbi:hypothetical protein K491DRAFT_744137 [Lophiostoma macrostomum CBS 122681]|uniref:Uncharacterized protein n=1 Tax=Lophiostoma macrostomum CBS 122681 TaxID=1314788 RepID=A0A6A6SHH8_9PLEO|nr:hypothetical protein K491DRAFT_744137 [Lophiostoma macrostomum CBS 122681]